MQATPECLFRAVVASQAHVLAIVLRLLSCIARSLAARFAGLQEASCKQARDKQVIRQSDKPAGSKPASQKASQQANERASEQTSKQASKHADKETIKQTRKTRRRLVFKHQQRAAASSPSKFSVQASEQVLGASSSEQVLQASSWHKFSEQIFSESFLSKFL